MAGLRFRFAPPPTSHGGGHDDVLTFTPDHPVGLLSFKLVATSEVLANPNDTTHRPKGVWTLPPIYALGDVDRAKYRAVGEADNFLLKFRRVG